ncbi:MAG: hypothetical protein WCK95_26695 [Alphaproteobacteria bacterium]
MQDFIRRKNIEHYRKLLAGRTLDEGIHEYVAKLLFDEEAEDLHLSAAQDEG